MEATAQINIRKAQERMDQERKEKLEQLYRRYEKTVYYLAYDILHNKQQAEDVVHDVFIKAVSYLDKLHPDEAEAKGFMVRLARTTAIDLYRRNQRESRLLEKAPQISGGDSIDEIEQYIESENGMDFIREVFRILKPDYREVIKLCCFYGMTVREAAIRLDQKEETVKKRYYRAREAVKKWMGEQSYEGK